MRPIPLPYPRLRRRTLAVLSVLMVVFTLGTMAAILGNISLLERNRTLVYRTLALEIGQTPMNYLLSRDDFPKRKLMIVLALSVSGALLLVNGLLLLLLFRTVRRLDESEKTKSAMISAITHDARFYLTVLKGRIDLVRMKLAEGIPLTKSAEDLQILSENALALNRLIVNLNDHELLSKGRMAVYPVPVDLRETLESLRVTLRPILEERTVNVSFDPPDGVFTFTTDARLADQVLLNLVHNAHKFSAAGEPIEVQVKRSGPAFCVVVRDRGLGIPPADQARLFTPFLKFNPKIKGNGLGLSNARQTARLLGGDLCLLESHPGLGSTFVFTMPIERDWEGAEGQA